LDFVALIGVGVAAFVATNIDDLFILVVFFATIPRFLISQIVLGQYVGMGSLIALSLLGSFISLVLPNNLVGLIGFIPIAIGIRDLLELRKKDDNKDKDNQEQERLTKQRFQSKTKYLLFLTVTAVTFSGGEEIGIYTSLFATNNEVGDIIILVSVVMVLTAFWCFLAHFLVSHSFLAGYIRRTGCRVLPFLLIGLGIYILAEAHLLVY
jgi:cadmium resistance protein CadD (predicted permease)